YLLSAAGLVLAGALLGGCLGWASGMWVRSPISRILLRVFLGVLVGVVAGFVFFEAGVVWESVEGRSQFQWDALPPIIVEYIAWGRAALGPCVVGIAALCRRRTE